MSEKIEEIAATIRDYRVEIEALRAELQSAPQKYEAALRRRATAEELERLEQEEIALERRLYNLIVGRLNQAGALTDDFHQAAARADREAYDARIAAETRFREGEIRRAQESAAEQQAWQEAEAALHQLRQRHSATLKILTDFVREYQDRALRRAQERRDQRAAELAAKPR